MLLSDIPGLFLSIVPKQQKQAVIPHGRCSNMHKVGFLLMYDCVVQGIETPSTFVYLAEMFHIENIGFLQKLVAVAVAGSKITTDPEGVFGTFPWYWIILCSRVCVNLMCCPVYCRVYYSSQVPSICRKHATIACWFTYTVYRYSLVGALRSFVGVANGGEFVWMQSQRLEAC